jgi:hypothetical protein
LRLFIFQKINQTITVRLNLTICYYKNLVEINTNLSRIGHPNTKFKLIIYNFTGRNTVQYLEYLTPVFIIDIWEIVNNMFFKI